jgi:biopolymer transport protein TolR
VIKRHYRHMADINVTNLVDVVLVLLIIFMITAPMLQSGIEVNLPKTKAATYDQLGEGIVLTIDKKGGVFVNDVWVRLADFEKKLDEVMKSKNTSSVYIRADSSVVYGEVVGVIGRLRKMGVEYLGLVTSPVEEKPVRRK